jgi:hypothetical protein
VLGEDGQLDRVLYVERRRLWLVVAGGQVASDQFAHPGDDRVGVAWFG